MEWLKLVGVALLACSIELTALAQGTDSAISARARFRRGVELFDSGLPELALIEFEAAYQLAPRFETLFTIGVTASRARRHDRAVSALSRYLDEGGDSIGAERRAQVEAELARLRSLVGTLQLEVLPDQADARIDGALIGTSHLPTPIT